MFEVQSEYRSGSGKPDVVTAWERRVASAVTYEAALIQLAYQQLVETRKLRIAAVGILALLIVCAAVGLLGMLALIGASN